MSDGSFLITFFSLPVLIFIVVLLLACIRQVNQYERGIMLFLGKYTGIKNPGWRLVIPVFQSMQKVDIRTKTVDVPEQEAITKDNIPIGINAVIYYRIIAAEKAILEVENFYYATSQLAQVTMRNAVGQVTLDELLKNREQVSQGIQEVVDKATDPWGIKVENLDLKDITIPQDLKRTIAKEAEAERERRAVIISSEGEVMAASNLVKAAGMLSSTPGALHLRTLQSINDISSDQSNTTIWMVPIEALRALEGLKKS
ncbi:slipin family protein [Patescibacteria group bacterium]|nr:slipin family protein [Patescibacteria group bacterium]MBU1703562.1 slipin family protein [Patescibacteria group bacterium]MBU1954290.1 slipin family protein [Patescibacteria group bacterium]